MDNVILKKSILKWKKKKKEIETEIHPSFSHD